MAECVQCGRALTDIHMFCPGCGTPVKKQAPAETAPAGPALTDACPVCGAGLPCGARFCGECGTTIEASAPAAAAPVTPAPAPDLAKTAGPAPVADTYVAPVIPVSTPVTPVAEPMTPANPAYGQAWSNGYSSSTWQQQTAPSQGYPYSPAPGYQATYHKPPNTFADYLAFRKMITPSWGIVMFWLFEGINLFYWVRFIYYNRYSAGGIIFGLISLCISALIIRIVMEVAITVVDKKDRN